MCDEETSSFPAAGCRDRDSRGANPRLSRRARNAAVPKTFDNELGLRYGAQVYAGSGQGPELQAFSVDYARYSIYNIGFRTG